jgi:hypothetical protein
VQEEGEDGDEQGEHGRGRLLTTAPGGQADLSTHTPRESREAKAQTIFPMLHRAWAHCLLWYCMASRSGTRAGEGRTVPRA